MGLLEDDSHLKFKPFIKKLWKDVKIIIIYGLIFLGLMYGVFSVMNLVGVK